MNTQSEKVNVVDTYRKRARNYDFTANLYYLIGFREWAYRKRAVAALNLSPGDTVVELGCGTGLNFALLQKAVGSTGKIIGVDLTDAMLSQARKRVAEQGWNNVELIQSDAAQYAFPPQVDGILSTFALSLVPEPDKVIESGAAALRPGKRWVVLDLKMPSNWLRHLTPIILPIVRPFAVTEALIDRQPWTIIRQTMEDQLSHVQFDNLYLGFAFMISGQRATG
ncbi:MAG: methyltransferase domain-containing protein [Anaerolineae bacterium]|nr:methyltransferase domain-containing protein [Anaerolineae bacterium]